jgi:hypothetical protein
MLDTNVTPAALIACKSHGARNRGARSSRCAVELARISRPTPAVANCRLRECCRPDRRARTARSPSTRRPRDRRRHRCAPARHRAVEHGHMGAADQQRARGHAADTRRRSGVLSSGAHRGFPANGRIVHVRPRRGQPACGRRAPATSALANARDALDDRGRRPTPTVRSARKQRPRRLRDDARCHRCRRPPAG